MKKTETAQIEEQPFSCGMEAVLDGLRGPLRVAGGPPADGGLDVPVPHRLPGGQALGGRRVLGLESSGCDACVRPRTQALALTEGAAAETVVSSYVLTGI